jgi:hypothetical protein
MSIVNAIPAVWAANILRALNTLLVYGGPDVINTDYEGDIAQSGDTVRITTLGDVTVQKYTRDADINPPEALTDAQLTLTIDQQDYFNFAVDDIDKRQAIPGLMDEAARRAAYGMRKTIDSFIASHYTDISLTNFRGTDAAPKTGFSANSKLAYNELVVLKKLLDETDTPEDGRFVVIPPWFELYLEQDDRVISFGTAATLQQMQEQYKAGDNGIIGRAAGFNVYRSNNVPNTGGAKWKLIAGHNSGWSFANQLVETVAFRPERRFADALKGLQVYGSKLVRPANMACLVATDA